MQAIMSDVCWLAALFVCGAERANIHVKGMSFPIKLHSFSVKRFML